MILSSLVGLMSTVPYPRRAVEHDHQRGVVVVSRRHKPPPADAARPAEALFSAQHQRHVALVHRGLGRAGAATIDGGYAVIAVAGGAGLARDVQAATQPLRWAAATKALLALATTAAGVRRYRSNPATTTAAA
jgi:hypothetical protein